MMEILRAAEASPEKAPDWREAVARFGTVLAEVDQLTRERQQTADLNRNLAGYLRQFDDAVAALAAAKQDHQRCKDALDASAASFARAEARHRDAKEDYQNYVVHKPGIWTHLRTWGRAREQWSIRAGELERESHDCKRQMTFLQQQDARARANLEEMVQMVRTCVVAHQAAEERYFTACRDLDVAQARWPGTVPPANLPSVLSPEEDEQLQLCAPWADAEFTDARSRLFLEALQLHKAFALRAGPVLRHNLAVAVHIIRTNHRVGPTVLEAAWQSFFLLVPLVSTTFASLPRLLSGLGRESVGWLFVDEAGQATPQQVTGGIWRAQRSVLVGDPRQIEPIVSLPEKSQHSLRRGCQVDEQWTPSMTSAQQVADRLNQFGTELRATKESDPVWLGAPLRVHRRCDRPFFDISNNIAYGGDLMVYGTSPRDQLPGQNCWVDVCSAESSGNWVPAEGAALTELLGRLTNEYGISSREILVISPFRSVADQARTIFGRLYGEDQSRKNVGTVHTFQGREAQVVVLVLGSPPDKGGARRWAAAKPNLLNVAVSRAQRRLYVIGNRQNWQTLPHFTELAAAIPVLTSGTERLLPRSDHREDRLLDTPGNLVANND